MVATYDEKLLERALLVMKGRARSYVEDAREFAPALIAMSEAVAALQHDNTILLEKLREFLEAGFTLEGWTCPAPCWAFNGAAKEWLLACRSCGRACPFAPPKGKFCSVPA